MASPQSTSLIQEYSHAFTSLQSGKRELIQWGAEPVVLNRYIVDAAESTAESDPQAVLRSIDLSKVTDGDTQKEREAYCEKALKNLVALQEEAAVLQKSARESGISAGLLTIIGQAAIQSPEDNGASVLRQLSELVDDEAASGGKETGKVLSLEKLDDESSDTISENKSEVQEIELDTVVAANDVDRLDFERMTVLQKLSLLVREQWRSLLFDTSASLIAVCIAISLIN